MHKAQRFDGKLGLILAAVWLLAACARQDATAVDKPQCTGGACAGSSASGAKDAGQAHLDAAASSTTGHGGSPASGGSGTGGTSNGAGGASAGTGGTGGTGSTSPGGGAKDAGPPLPALPDFTLVVDTPHDGDTVSGTVTVSGRAKSFLNVEVWDAKHSMPPLAQATPAADSSFSVTIDTSALANGATTWTVYAWDSPPGQSFMHTSSVTLNLTIGGAPAVVSTCSGQTCSGHGSCSVSSGQAGCGCDAGYHAVSLSCIADSSGNDGTPDPGTQYVPTGYNLVFSDEFSASTIDTGKWNTLAPFGVQFFTDSHQKQAFIPEAVGLHDGIVSFTAQHSSGNTNGQPYSSGSITTNGTFTYGYFETRAKVPAGKGFWPAFWLTSSKRWPPEWDIFEIIDGVIYGYTHPVSGGKCSFVDGAAGSDSTYTVSNVYGAYHVYGFKWTASDIYWYVDGTMTEHYAIDAAAGANDPFWLNISLQVGGDWPGDPDSSTPLPSQMDVDYIRVYQQ